MATAEKSVLALSGGVGGAKLALGLADELPPGELHVVVNTGDDFSHLGLHICPDIDTLLYTLSGNANAEQGWGLEGESWNTMDALQRLGGETWFRLGDRDLATHLWRTDRLAQGDSLLEVTGALATRLGISSHIHPMCSTPVRTTVHSEERDLPFQQYFVKEQCAPIVSGFSFEGITEAAPNQNVMQLLQDAALSAIVVCPSNPFVSIDPMLQIPGMWQALRDSPAPLVMVSPIVAGMALKGPAAKMMAEMSMPVTAQGVAQHYCRQYPGLVDYFVIDESDATLAAEIAALGMEVAVAPTIMKTREDKQRLARFTLSLVGA
ncbi:2-phospho-L-lactate transferase [Halioglobus japonicus]|nr:2-phospho-L-lactate transferase [Halioglobus japonicus]